MKSNTASLAEICIGAGALTKPCLPKVPAASALQTKKWPAQASAKFCQTHCTNIELGSTFDFLVLENKSSCQQIMNVNDWYTMHEHILMPNQARHNTVSGE